MSNLGMYFDRLIQLDVLMFCKIHVNVINDLSAISTVAKSRQQRDYSEKENYKVTK